MAKWLDDKEDRGDTLNSKTIVFHQPQHTVISIVIKGTKYSLPAFFSMNDLETYLGCLEQGDDYKRALAVVISEKIAKQKLLAPAIETICDEEDSAFAEFVFAVVNSDAELKRIFDDVDSNLPLLQRFAVAQQLYLKMCADNISKAIKPIIDNYQQLHKISINLICDTLLRTAQALDELSSSIRDSMLGYFQSISDTITRLTIPSVSDERKKELIETHQAWGKLGWTIILNAPDNLFDSYPPTTFQANKLAMRYCGKQDMQRLFNEMKTMKIKKNDLTEAIHCYEKGYYKACALILFGLIDAKLIRKQSKDSSKRRKTGVSAMKIIKQKVEQETNINKTLFYLLDFLTLTSCVYTLFGDGNDFTDEPTTINRNFVDHGMSTKRVRKRDCVQLFLALYNLVSCLDY